MIAYPPWVQVFGTNRQRSVPLGYFWIFDPPRQDVSAWSPEGTPVPGAEVDTTRLLLQIAGAIIVFGTLAIVQRRPSASESSTQTAVR
jgi:hypothetical protein